MSATFRALTPEGSGPRRRARTARRPFDREALAARARDLRVPVAVQRRFPEARALLESRS